MGDATKLRDMTAFASLSFPAALAASLKDGLLRSGADQPHGGQSGRALSVARIDAPLQTMVAVADHRSLHVLEFFDRRIFGAQMEAVAKATDRRFCVEDNAVIVRLRAELEAYFRGECSHFETPLALHGTPFVQSVWRALLQVPAGETRSYGALSRDLKNPGAVRAVAQANGANRIAVIVPCHRIIGTDGSLTGYGGGLWRKRWLLDHEARHFGNLLL